MEEKEMKPINRERMAYLFMLFVFLWYLLVVISVKWLTISVMEGVGLGTAGGVFLGAFKDMWQFLWRTASPQEKALGESKSTKDNSNIEPPPNSDPPPDNRTIVHR
jgi:hypothetical protein